MGEQDSNQHLARLANAIYVEIRRQFDCAGPSVPVVCDHAGMRDVFVEGHIDLLKVAAALSARCCVQMPDIETVDEPMSAGRSKKPDHKDRASAP
ncbi:MAG TPA: hypothetical protein VGO04_06465 [Ensifer sp.]|jgi:hypothetical protein|uniref:hypothetical protein n=1 Tax=Ensifer sp. TaxID=1872086 RepID=UPI002E142A18|nr:hypothetical protein [Ensifer sp.]